MKLVIIESPFKREALKKYLGDGYEVFATKGHIRDLPAKSFAIDMRNNFEPRYEIVPEKKALIVTASNDKFVIGSAANIPGVKTATPGTLNVYDILNCDKFIVVKDAAEKMQEVYA